MLQFLALSVRLRNFPRNGSFCSLYDMAPFWLRRSIHEVSRLVCFPCQVGDAPVTKAAQKLFLREEKVIKNENKMSRVTKKSTRPSSPFPHGMWKFPGQGSNLCHGSDNLGAFSHQQAITVCLFRFHKVAANTFLSSHLPVRELKPLSGWVVTACAVGIDAIGTRGNRFKAWVPVVPETLPLQSTSLTLRRVTSRRAAWLRTVRFCWPPSWGPQSLVFSLYCCLGVFFKLDNKQAISWISRLKVSSITKHWIGQKN